MTPLGLPQGSVRAIILIALTAAIVIPVFVFMFRQTDIPPGIREFLTALVIADLGLIKDYLSNRPSDDKQDAPPPVGPGGAA